MQYTEGQLDRIFALRLEDGEPMPQTLETFLTDQGITHGLAFMVGGADDGSKLVVGPEDGRALPVNPMVTALIGAHEILGVGTIFPDETGQPVLHMHGACGRNDSTITGCIRAGIKTWHILEIIVLEITGLSAVRRPDAATGFHLLQCGRQD
jgi:predicted DNA-binding protein with PD1-like motif